MRICRKENKKDFEPILVDCKRFGYDDYVVVGNKEDNVKLYERVKNEGISPSNLPSTSTSMVERLVDYFINDMDITGSLANIGNRISEILEIPMLEMEIEETPEVTEDTQYGVAKRDVMAETVNEPIEEIEEDMESQVGHQAQVEKRDTIAIKMGHQDQVAKRDVMAVKLNEEIQERIIEIRDYMKETLTQSLDIQETLAECSTETSKTISDIFDKVESINNKLDKLSISQPIQNTINTQVVQNNEPIDDSKLEERVALFIKILHLLQGDVVVKVLSDIIIKLSTEENEHVAEFMSVFLQELQKR